MQRHDDAGDPAVPDPLALVPEDVIRRSRPGGRRFAAGLAMGALAAGTLCLLDLWTGKVEIDFTILYGVPVALVTWFLGPRAGLLTALLTIVLDVSVDLRLERYDVRLSHLAWNVGIEIVFFGSVVMAADRLRADLAAQRSLAQRLGRAYGRLDQEMDLVGRVQRGLLPPGTPSMPGWRVAVHYEASMRAGGDYYDFLCAPDGRVGVLVADASGHGPAAAVLMAMLRVLAHDARDDWASAPVLLRATNRRLSGSIPDSQFLTAAYVVVEPGEGGVEYSLAGHPSPLLARADGTWVALEEARAMPLGIDGDVAYEAGHAHVQPGDVLLLCTDGILEARDPEGRCLGEEAVQETLLAARAGGAQAVIDALLARMARHTGGARPDDDVTLVAIARDPAPPRAG